MRVRLCDRNRKWSAEADQSPGFWVEHLNTYEEAHGRAEHDFANGDYIELTVEQLDRCVATGESPWPDAS